MNELKVYTVSAAILQLTTVSNFFNVIMVRWLRAEVDKVVEKST